MDGSQADSKPSAATPCNRQCKSQQEVGCSPPWGFSLPIPRLERWMCGNLGNLDLEEGSFEVIYKVMAVLLISTTEYSYFVSSFSAPVVLLKHHCVIHVHSYYENFC